MPLDVIKEVNGETIYEKTFNKYGKARFYCATVTISNPEEFNEFVRRMNSLFGRGKINWHIPKGKIRRKFRPNYDSFLGKPVYEPQTLRTYINVNHFESEQAFQEFLDATEVYNKLSV